MPVNGVPRARSAPHLSLQASGAGLPLPRSDKTGAVYAFALTLECAATITLTATGINLTIELWSSPPYQVSELQNLAFRIGSYQHHLLDLAAYLVLLGLLASLLGLAATRAWGRVGTPESDAVNSDDQDLRSAVGERWSTLDAGVLFRSTGDRFHVRLGTQREGRQRTSNRRHPVQVRR